MLCCIQALLGHIGHKAIYKLPATFGNDNQGAITANFTLVSHLEATRPTYDDPTHETATPSAALDPR